MAGPKGATVVRRALLVLLLAWAGWCALAVTQLAIVYAQQETAQSVIACTRRDRSVFVAREGGEVVDLAIPYPPSGSGVLVGEVDGDVVLPENSAAVASMSEP